MWGFGIRVEGLGIRVEGVGFQDQGCGFGVSDHGHDAVPAVVRGSSYCYRTMRVLDECAPRFLLK